MESSKSKGMFNHFEVEKILSIPPTIKEAKDKLISTKTKNGKFSVKFAY